MGNETTGYPCSIGTTSIAEQVVNLKLSEIIQIIRLPLEFLALISSHNTAKGSLEFVTDGTADFISGNNTFFRKQ